MSLYTTPLQLYLYLWTLILKSDFSSFFFYNFFIGVLRKLEDNNNWKYKNQPQLQAPSLRQYNTEAVRGSFKFSIPPPTQRRKK